MTTAQLKETPLAAAHRKLGARMVDFAGWNMPVQYKSIVAEHMAVRTRVGLFDVSHMGEFVVEGSGAHQFLQYVIANDLNRLNMPNMALYTQLVMDNGGTVDDLIVYRRKRDYLLVVNASNIDKDWEWLSRHQGKFADVSLRNESEETGLLALQGPRAHAIMKELVGSQIDQLRSFGYAAFAVDGIKISFGRTGYTGEDGFEIFVDYRDTEKAWNLLMESGQSHGIEPCGLGARDTLRLEAGLPLYGHELDENTSPIEAGLSWSVKLDKGDFLGRELMRRQRQGELTKQLVGLKVEGRALPRQGYAVYKDERKVGVVTSGSQGIFLGYPIAFAFVPPALASLGEKLQVEIRDSLLPGAVVQRPFYKRKD